MPGKNFPHLPGETPEICRLLAETDLSIRAIARIVDCWPTHVSRVRRCYGLRPAQPTVDHGRD